MARGSEFDDVIDVMHALKICASHHASTGAFSRQAAEFADMLAATDKSRGGPGICTAVANAIRTEFANQSAQ